MTNRLPTLIVSGYASIDYAMRLAPFEGHDATTLVRDRAEEWPRSGGIAHVTRAASREAGDAVRVAALSWVGPDPEGTAWLHAVEADGVEIVGVARRGTRSPSSHLLYPDGQGTICLFDAADCHGELDERQRELLSGADLAVVTIGPERATRELLDAIPGSCAVLWVIKQDPSSLTDELAAALGGRANVVTLSDGEQSYLDGIVASAAPGAYIIVTRGSRGAVLHRVSDNGVLERIGEVPAHPVTGVDTTGAGDTFSGTLAALLAARPDPEPDEMLRYLHRASEATAEMLAARLPD
ncbi:carbohydrate kinase family protein [Leucobacter sp. GX24907]